MATNYPLPPTTFPAPEQRSSSDAQTSKRRKFQVPITRYFNVAESGSDSPSQSLSPQLPDSVQSSLLTVGMRIRKSVPEGYKTELKKQLYSPMYQSSLQSYSGNSYNELAPFCGLHKVGGLAVQPLPPTFKSSMGFSSAESSITLSAAEQEDPFSFPSSQESTYTTASDVSAMPPSRSKRGLDDVEDDDDDEVSSEQMGLNHDGHTYPFSHTGMPDLNMMASPPTTLKRAFAQPRSRRSPGNRSNVDNSNRAKWKGADQENAADWRMRFDPMTLANSGNLDADFEEADFLQRREDVEMGM